MRVIQVVRSDSFAGVERYISTVGPALAKHGVDVAVIGGDRHRMQPALGSIWHRPATTTRDVVRELRAAKYADIVHAHMTAAELAAALVKARLGARLVVTRHFASGRGSTMPARWVGRWIARRIDAEIAISEFVNRSLGGRALVLHNGVPDAEASLGDAKTVIVAQRLEAEKDTWTALRAWRLSGLAEEGWRLVVAGSGSDAEPLASMVRQEAILGVAFVGHLSDLGGAFRSASVLLATAPSEPFGLTVVEAMAAALPVVAADGGAHRETVGASSPEMLFAPGDAVSCARQLRRLAESPSLRREVGRRNQTLQRDRFVLDLHVSALLDLYRSVSCVA